jgi:FkbM family methyltransferase
MKILYGKDDKTIDVTEICNTKCKYNDVICIPDNDDNRVFIFNKDPYWGVVKNVYIEINGIVKEYDDKTTIFINTISGIITTIDRTSIIEKLATIQKKLKLKYGTFYEELPEQKMALTYLSGKEKVLEIGGNIGRNSLLIGHILGDNSNNYVTLEADEDIAHKLCENRDNNNMDFNIEGSALSTRKLITRNDIIANTCNEYVISNSNTIESDDVPNGYKRVNTITLDELNNKYNIAFDTLIIDCEGAFYNILQDFPNILNNIKLIIMENDYDDISKKQYVDEQLKRNNFKMSYFEAGGKGPCFANFFEVWKRAD